MTEIHFLVEEAPESGFVARAMGAVFLPRRTASTACMLRFAMQYVAT